MSETITPWNDLLAMHFGLKLPPNEVSQWFIELRSTVYGWEYAPNEDPLSGEGARLVGKELGDALRATRHLKPIPRSDPSHKVYQYTVADVALWVEKYRKQRKYESAFDTTPIFRAAQAIIKNLVRQKRFADAAFTVYNPLETKEGEIYMFEVAKLGSCSPTEEQSRELDRFCVSLGFDPKRERAEWDKKNYKRVMAESASGPFGKVLAK